VTQSLIPAEFVASGAARRPPRATVLEFVQATLENPDIDVVWVDRDLLETAWEPPGQRRDKTCSWCDAVRFVVMTQRGITEALSTDRHFDQQGFRRFLP
jgi:predicted nucleic acid-binding protein